MSSIPTPPFRLVRALTSNGTKFVGSIAVFLAGSLLANFIALIAAGAALYQAHTAKEELDDQRVKLSPRPKKCSRPVLMKLQFMIMFQLLDLYLKETRNYREN